MDYSKKELKNFTNAIKDGLHMVISDLPEGYKDKYPFKDGEQFLCFGEIKNMKGHIAIVDRKGKVYFGYHIENFRLLTNDD